MSAVLSPGSTLPLIINPKAFSKVPAAGLPFPSAPYFRTVLAVQGLSGESFQTHKRFYSAAHTSPTPWTAPGRSENLPMRRERGQMQRPNAAQLVAFPRPGILLDTALGTFDVNMTRDPLPQIAHHTERRRPPNPIYKIT